MFHCWIAAYVICLQYKCQTSNHLLLLRRLCHGHLFATFPCLCACYFFLVWQISCLFPLCTLVQSKSHKSENISSFPISDHHSVFSANANKGRCRKYFLGLCPNSGPNQPTPSYESITFCCGCGMWSFHIMSIHSM